MVFQTLLYGNGVYYLVYWNLMCNVSHARTGQFDAIIYV